MSLAWILTEPIEIVSPSNFPQKLKRESLGEESIDRTCIYLNFHSDRNLGDRNVNVIFIYRSD
jgi:hypothetical protein